MDNTAVCPSIWYKALTPNPSPREGEGLLSWTRSFDKVLYMIIVRAIN